MENIMRDIYEKWIKRQGCGFSGVFSATGSDGAVFQQACGNRNMAEELPNTDECGESYGLGIYRNIHEDNVSYYAVGGDSGVDYFTAYFPQSKIVVSALCNVDGINTFPLLGESFDLLA